MKSMIVTVSLLFVMFSALPAQNMDQLFNDYIMNLPNEALSEQELAGLMQMREEEKLARDVYLTLYDTWQMNIFYNIATRSEQSHIEMVGLIIEKYNLEDPFIEERGVFTDSTMQALYNSLVEIGVASLSQGLFVGCTIEDLDIFDLENLLVVSDNQDVRTVYQNLMKGSRNHMRAFYSQYSAQDETYEAQFITPEELEQILAGTEEKGFVDADGAPLVLTGIAANAADAIPESFIVMQNYPNPFNPSTTIQFSIPTNSIVSVDIFDVSGALIRTLAANEELQAGQHSFTWNGLDESGSQVVSGVYFYRVSSGAFQITKQMTLVK